MNRSDLQKLAELRIEDARALLDEERLAGAYYLSGYAVECALKSCIAKQVHEHDFPDKRLVLDSYSHDLEKLLRVSGIEGLHEVEMRSNPAFAINWEIVDDWSEESRYEVSVPEEAARGMFAAVTDSANGVLTWLKKLW
jgi:HEPN domain-containing protein